jgi:hypothetical protein
LHRIYKEVEKKKKKEKTIPVDISNLTGKTHLVQSKLWEALENK